MKNGIRYEDLQNLPEPFKVVQGDWSRSSFYGLELPLRLMVRVSNGSEPVTVIETYGGIATVFVTRSNLSRLGVWCGGSAFSINLTGDPGVAIFVPPFTIIRWQICAGSQEWYCYGLPLDALPRHEELPVHPTAMNWDDAQIFRTPKTLAEQLVSRRSEWDVFKPSAMASDLVAAVKKQLDLRFKEFVKIQDICAEIGTSPNYISRAFKDYYGLGPQEYLAELRVFESQREILFKDGQNLIASGFNAGFQDVSRFNKNFKRRFGHSPRKFIK
ncbi:MAG: AraC family transcriptional regulator [Bdellovibrionales bacterium]|nr:AraC family transcriptional regulator [Bdellovibrionales bacterium]